MTIKPEGHSQVIRLNAALKRMNYGFKFDIVFCPVVTIFTVCYYLDLGNYEFSNEVGKVGL